MGIIRNSSCFCTCLHVEHCEIWWLILWFIKLGLSICCRRTLSLTLFLKMSPVSPIYVFFLQLPHINAYIRFCELQFISVLISNNLSAFWKSNDDYSKILLQQPQRLFPHLDTVGICNSEFWKDALTRIDFKVWFCLLLFTKVVFLKTSLQRVLLFNISLLICKKLNILTLLGFCVVTNVIMSVSKCSFGVLKVVISISLAFSILYRITAKE